jgi:hypothetical protein
MKSAKLDCPLCGVFMKRVNLNAKPKNIVCHTYNCDLCGTFTTIWFTGTRSDFAKKQYEAKGGEVPICQQTAFEQRAS